MHLLRTRRFLPLFITQFLGSFNNNMFKNALVMYIAFRAAGDAPGQAQLLVTLAGALFIAPFFLFSSVAGQLADKFDRARIARAAKLWELLVVAVAAFGFYLGNVYFLLLVLFIMGMQATLFGPVKYALLPQHLRYDELIAGNSYIEAGTFLAILMGTIAGGVLILTPQGDHFIALSMIAVGLAGYATSRAIPPAPAPSPQIRIGRNILRDSWRMVASERAVPSVYRAILAISWFWLVGATFLSQFPAFTKEVLRAQEGVVTLFLTMFSVGIAIGSLLCNRLLKGEITTRFVPHAAFGISLFTLDFYLASSAVADAPDALPMATLSWLAEPAHWRLLIDLLGVAICAGLFIVPLYAILQHDSDPACRARTIASNNIVNAIFMVASAIAVIGLLAAGFTTPQIFLALAVGNTGVGVWLWRVEKRLRAKPPV